MNFHTILLNIQNCQDKLSYLVKAIKNPINFYKTKNDYLQSIETDVTNYKKQEQHLKLLIDELIEKCKNNNKTIHFTDEFTIHDKVNFVNTSKYF